MPINPFARMFFFSAGIYVGASPTPGRPAPVCVEPSFNRGIKRTTIRLVFIVVKWDVTSYRPSWELPSPGRRKHPSYKLACHLHLLGEVRALGYRGQEPRSRKG